jgi:SAM-dependent methyltransferase
MRKIFWFLSSFNIDSPRNWGIESNVHLDIGCGLNPRNPFMAPRLLAADIFPKTDFFKSSEFEYIQVKLTGEIPLPDESVDSISGFDFLEHLPRGSTIETNMFIKFMNEASRVLKSGGVLFLVTPAFPSSAAFQDPTHVNFISESTLNYFIGSNPGAKSLGYGFTGSFELLTQDWVGPLSKVWDESFIEVNGKGNKALELLTRLAHTIRSFSRARALLSSLRNPTHLLWLLRKT